MEYAILIGCILIMAVIVLWVLQLEIKKVKKWEKDEELNELAKKFPENIEIAKSILEQLGNETVVIKEEKESKTSLYLVMTNTISIANLRR